MGLQCRALLDLALTGATTYAGYGLHNITAGRLATVFSATHAPAGLHLIRPRLRSATFALRSDRSAALTVHRTVIHFRRLRFAYLKGKAYGGHTGPPLRIQRNNSVILSEAEGFALPPWPPPRGGCRRR